MVVLSGERGMSNLSALSKQKVQILYELSGWIQDCIRRIDDGDDEKAAIKLDKIIEEIENPVVVQNLKDVAEELWL
jgi:hypothetical protein